MILKLNMMMRESSEERINENYFKQFSMNNLVWAFNNMDNARKKYVNMERLSSADIFAWLDSIMGQDNDDEGDIENIMNDSDKEILSEGESAISTSIIKTKAIGDQSSSVSVPEASIDIFSSKNKDESDTLGQDKPSPAPNSQRTSNQSSSPPTQRTSNQTSSPVNQQLLLLDVLLISHANLLHLLQLLYPKTPRNESKARWSKTKQKRKG